MIKLFRISTFAIVAALMGCSSPIEPSPKTEQSDVVSAVAPSIPVITSPSKTTRQADTEFAFKLYRELAAREPEKNLVVSPLSVLGALAMVYPGATGETQAEIGAVTGFDTVASNSFFEGRRSLNSALNRDKDGNTFFSANAVYVDDKVDLQPAYSNLLKTELNATPLPLPLSSNSPKAVGVINKWICLNTRGLISDALRKDTFTVDDRVALINTAYLKANWQIPFPNLKAPPEAYSTAKGPIDVAYIHDARYVPYLKTDTAALISLAYQDGDMMMVVALPDKRIGLVNFENELNEATFQKWLDDLFSEDSPLVRPRSKYINIKVPKLNQESSLDLVQALSDMGMARVFSPSLSELDAVVQGQASKGQKLHVSRAEQAARLVLDEKGTEAAAVTSMIFSAVSANPTHIEFIANRPFAYFIIDTSTREILFMGRVTDPSEK